MNKNQTHLKCISNGRVFLFSETLSARSDMIACDAQGNIAEGHIGDVDAIEAGQTQRVTKFLGSLANGALYPYRPFLAARGDMIPIDTEEQWETMRKSGEAPEVSENVIAPTLGRSETVEQTEKVVVPTSAQGPGTGIQLPVIEGMGAREAKTALADWAMENFNTKIDKRPVLAEVVLACQSLANSGVAKVG